MARSLSSALDRRGYWLLPTDLADGAPQDLAADGAGDRTMLEQPWCRELAARLHTVLAARDIVAADAVAVQCTLFDKGMEQNWLVPMHQDLVVPVRERRPAKGWTRWSIKDGVPHAEPPVALLQQMIAARLHLDDATPQNGALVVVPGSHRQGRLTTEAAAAARARTGEVMLTARRGDVLLLRPLLLHRSGKATVEQSRRVLHFVFAPPEPGGGLAWRHGAAPTAARN